MKNRRMAHKLMTQPPHWKCVYCRFKRFNPILDLPTQRCRCGIGKGRWAAITRAFYRRFSRLNA